MSILGAPFNIANEGSCSEVQGTTKQEILNFNNRNIKICSLVPP